MCYYHLVTRSYGSMHVAEVVRKYETKAGPSESRSYLLRRSFREDGKVRHETLANLSALPPQAVAALREVLAGKTLVVADEGFELLRARPHGHVAAVAAQAKALGFPELLGPSCKERDIAYALVLSRVVRPKPKLATLSWWKDTTLYEDLGLEEVSTDEAYAAMDWLYERQDVIERALSRRHLSVSSNPSGRAYFDLSSSWMEGRTCPLASFGYSRDKKRGKPQIEYGLLTDPAGCPVAIRVFPGNTADPVAFREIVDVVRENFGLTHLVMVGDRGMITSARIEALKGLGGLGWLTALRAPQIKALAEDQGPLQLSLFDEVNFCELTHPEYPDERLVACRNPLLAIERARKREALLSSSEAAVAPIIARVQAGRLKGKEEIAFRLAKVLNRFKMEKHFVTEIADDRLVVVRDEDSITAEAALDGIYVLRTTIGGDELDAAGVISAYKDLAGVERDFRSMKVIDVDLRPVHHRLEDRVRAHAFICMLSTYLTFHLRRSLAPLTFTDTEPPTRDDPVAPAAASKAAKKKAAAKKNAEGQEVRGFRELLEHLGTLTRNRMRVASSPEIEFDLVATPTPTQRRVFELLGVPVPKHLV
jgi:transposase